MTFETPKSVLEQISTCWPMINNPVQFVMRYARAIRKYVAAVVRDPDQAEEVSQDFLVQVFGKGFCPQNVSRGRFRDYLKSAVRYVAISHLRKRRESAVSEEQLALLIQPDSEADREWASEWRNCLLERVWQVLEMYQRETSGNLYYSVLRQYVDDPDSDSETHAARLGNKLGRPVRADAFRQYLSRSRRHFAKLIVDEVRRTLQKPTREDIEQELIDLELMSQVRDYLPS